MRVSRKKYVQPIFNARVAHNLEILAEALGVQFKEVKRWRKEGLISFPVKEDEFAFIVKLVNIVWGNYHAIRCQLGQMSVAKRQALVRTAELNSFEVDVFNMVLRWKLEFPKRYLRFPEARNIIRARYPNGYVLLNNKMLKKAKKSANYEISKAKRKGTLDLLLTQMNMGVIDGGKITHKRRKASYQNEGPLMSAKEKTKFLNAPPIENDTKSIGISPEKPSRQEFELTAEELSYLEENFKDSVDRIKAELQRNLSRHITLKADPENQD